MALIRLNPRYKIVSEGGGYLAYDRRADIFYHYEGDGPRPSYATMVAEGCYQLRDPDTSEIVGHQVENWEYAFLRQYPDIAALWRRTPLYFRTRYPAEALLGRLWRMFVSGASDGGPSSATATPDTARLIRAIESYCTVQP